MEEKSNPNKHNVIPLQTKEEASDCQMHFSAAHTEIQNTGIVSLTDQSSTDYSEEATSNSESNDDSNQDGHNLGEEDEDLNHRMESLRLKEEDLDHSFSSCQSALDVSSCIFDENSSRVRNGCNASSVVENKADQRKSV
eukprot:3733808-Ditylum_brightwellii.AAC.1